MGGKICNACERDIKQCREDCEKFMHRIWKSESACVEGIKQVIEHYETFIRGMKLHKKDDNKISNEDGDKSSKEGGKICNTCEKDSKQCREDCLSLFGLEWWLYVCLLWRFGQNFNG